MESLDKGRGTRTGGCGGGKRLCSLLGLSKLGPTSVAIHGNVPAAGRQVRLVLDFDRRSKPQKFGDNISWFPILLHAAQHMSVGVKYTPPRDRL